MATSSGLSIIWKEARQIAQVLEGIAASLKQGQPLDSDDVGAAIQSSRWIWAAGPKPLPRRVLDFDVALRQFEYASGDCLHGSPQIGRVHEAAHLLAKYLRNMASDSQRYSGRKELPLIVGQRVDWLANKYSRFAPSPLETIAR